MHSLAFPNQCFSHSFLDDVTNGNLVVFHCLRAGEGKVRLPLAVPAGGFHAYTRDQRETRPDERGRDALHSGFSQRNSLSSSTGGQIAA